MPRRPPSPDFSHLTAAEVEIIVAVLRRLKEEEERELQREREVKAVLATLQDKEDTEPSDGSEVCEDCMRVRTCSIIPQINTDSLIYLCEECTLKRQHISISGLWYNSCGIADTLSVCNNLLHKATGEEAVPTLTEEEKRATEIARLEQEQREKEKQERAEQERLQKEKEEAERLKRERIEQERLEREKAEREREEQERLQAERESAEKAKQEAAVLVTVDAASEPSATSTATLSANHTGGATTGTQPVDETDSKAVLAQEAAAAILDGSQGNTGESVVTTEETKFGPGQVTEGLEDFSPLGYLELQLQVGADGNERAGLIIDVKKGYDFKMWQKVGKKPSFSLYVKCYLVFPQSDRLVRMKTQLVTPAVEPAFDDQLITVMSKELLGKAKALVVQIWQHNGAMKRNLPVASGSIDLTKLRLEQPVVACYPLFKPGSQSFDAPLSPYATLRSNKSQSLSPKKKSGSHLEPPSTKTM